MLLFRKILPVHFLNKSELGREEEIMRDWLDVLVTESGLLVAQQTIERPPLMVAQMTRLSPSTHSSNSKVARLSPPA